MNEKIVGTNEHVSLYRYDIPPSVETVEITTALVAGSRVVTINCHHRAESEIKFNSLQLLMCSSDNVLEINGLPVGEIEAQNWITAYRLEESAENSIKIEYTPGDDVVYMGVRVNGMLHRYNLHGMDADNNRIERIIHVDSEVENDDRDENHNPFGYASLYYPPINNLGCALLCDGGDVELEIAPELDVDPESFENPPLIKCRGIWYRYDQHLDTYEVAEDPLISKSEAWQLEVPKSEHGHVIFHSIVDGNWSVDACEVLEVVDGEYILFRCPDGESSAKIIRQDGKWMLRVTQSILSTLINY